RLARTTRGPALLARLEVPADHLTIERHGGPVAHQGDDARASPVPWRDAHRGVAALGIEAMQAPVAADGQDAVVFVEGEAADRGVVGADGEAAGRAAALGTAVGAGAAAVAGPAERLGGACLAAVADDQHGGGFALAADDGVQRGDDTERRDPRVAEAPEGIG